MGEINSVRQVLMNELGLTRESVRGIVETITEQILERKIEQMLASGHLQKMVDTHIDIAMRSDLYSRAAIKKLIGEAAGKAFGEAVLKMLNNEK